MGGLALNAGARKAIRRATGSATVCDTVTNPVDIHLLECGDSSPFRAYYDKKYGIREPYVLGEASELARAETEAKKRERHLAINVASVAFLGGLLVLIIVGLRKALSPARVADIQQWHWGRLVLIAAVCGGFGLLLKAVLLDASMPESPLLFAMINALGATGFFGLVLVPVVLTWQWLGARGRGEK